MKRETLQAMRQIDFSPAYLAHLSRPLHEFESAEIPCSDKLNSNFQGGHAQLNVVQ